jgi:hypothetical protein
LPYISPGRAEINPDGRLGNRGSSVAERPFYTTNSFRGSWPRGASVGEEASSLRHGMASVPAALQLQMAEIDYAAYSAVGRADTTGRVFSCHSALVAL